MSFASYKSGSTKNEALHLKKAMFLKSGESDDDEDEESEDEESEDEGIGGRGKKIQNLKGIDEESDNEVSVDDSVYSEDDNDDNSIGGDSVDSNVEEDDTNIQKILGGNISDDEEEEDEDEEDDDYLKKFDENIKKNVISEFHPEMLVHNYDEIDVLSRVVRNEEGIIIDPLHKTLPFITKYEKARILGERAKQIDAGCKAFVDVDPDVIDGYIIALKEYEAKKIPFILKRPFSGGNCEYWKFCDLEILH
jgi:DNA-directed RNA polymerase I, II, and III subunit RPABC2